MEYVSVQQELISFQVQEASYLKHNYFWGGLSDTPDTFQPVITAAAWACLLTLAGADLLLLFLFHFSLSISGDFYRF